jgi:hypothetical protein
MCQETSKSLSPIESPRPVPFDSAEEAWFWFIRCQKMRSEGVKYRPATLMMPRPCEPVDVYCVAKKLHQVRRLTDLHLGALARFGMLECPPDPRNREEQLSATLWDEALDRMLTPLRIKGIVGMPECSDMTSGYAHAAR